jgi:hypothetical protein
MAAEIVVGGAGFHSGVEKTASIEPVDKAGVYLHTAEQ